MRDLPAGSHLCGCPGRRRQLPDRARGVRRTGRGLAGMAEIGFIGLGNMGFPMASRLIAEGNDVIAFDTSSTALDRIVSLGGQAASSAKEVADRAETVLASLPSPAVSLEVATGTAGVIAGSRIKRYVD